MLLNQLGRHLRGALNTKFKFGKKIFEKIVGAIQPTFEDDTPVNVFDLWEGAAFKLRMRKVEGYPNYDQSNFEAPSEIADSDDAILKIMNQVTSLAPIMAPAKFKSYAELATKLASIDADGGGGSTAEKAVEQMRSEPTRPAKAIETPAKAAPMSQADEDEDLTEYFANMSK
jgi:hypothetical protein